MRILLEDLARTATISSDYETTTYPASNVADVFLDTLYVSILPSDILTIDFGQLRPIDSIYIAGCNATSVAYEVFDNYGTVIYSGTIDITRDVCTEYFAELSARKVVFTIDLGFAEGDYIKIKGIGCGVTHRVPWLLNNVVPSISNETASIRTKTGQVLRGKAPSILSYEITIPKLTLQEVKDTSKLLDTIGIHWPTYWDLAEGTEEYFDPIYAEISDVWAVSKIGGNRYNLTLTIKETR